MFFIYKNSPYTLLTCYLSQRSYYSKGFWDAMELDFIPLSTPPPPLAQVVGAAASKCSATTELLAITTTTNIIPQDQFSTFGFFLVLGFQGCSFILVAFLLLCTHLCAAGDFCSPDDQWQPMQWH